MNAKNRLPWSTARRGLLASLALSVCLTACSTVSAFSPALATLLSPSQTPTAIPASSMPAPSPSAAPTLEITATQPAPSQTPPVTDLHPAATTEAGADLPVEHFIPAIQSIKQQYSLSCEARAAVDFADYFGVTLSEFDFQYGLPLSDNPDKGFVGDVNDPWGQVPPYSYGVHAAPVAALLNAFGLPAVGAKGLTTAQLKAELASDQPVIVWVIGNMTSGPPAEYTDSEGDTTLVAAYEHVVTLTGYDEDSIRYVTSGKFYEVPTEIFERSWAVLGSMAIYYDDNLIGAIP